jgi:hypothetical protein
MSSACSASTKAHWPPVLLHLGDDLQRQRGLAGRFRAVDLDHAAARQAAHAQGDVQSQRAGGDDLDVLDDLALAQAHDGALAELLFDLGQGGLQGLGALAVGGRCWFLTWASMRISFKNQWVWEKRCLTLKTGWMLEQ